MRSIMAAIAIVCTVTAVTAIADDVATNAPNPAPVPGATVPTLDRADLEAWLDGIVPYAVDSGDIAGGVVAVVKNGEILLQKGYGYADVENRRPVDPERTLFRTGSVSKLVTHTAAMQLVEQGKLDLDADVARYLDFEIPAAFDRGMTLRDLMTHTGGFNEMARQLMAADPASFVPLDTFIKTTPERIFPPAKVPSYCNYCLALEGYIIQRVSGQSFDDYLDQHIFAPLGMQRSTFRQPLPAQFEGDMSKGYEVASGPAKYFELVGPAPAGSMSATGADMARFMIAHLGAQQGREPRLLRPETAERMYTSMFRATTPTLGMSLGFFERDRNGQRILGHAGDTQFFHSDLLLFMDRDVGLFMSFNSAGKESSVYTLRTALFEKFADRYFPAPPPERPTLASAVEHGRQLAGTYGVSRRSETSFFKLFTLLGQFKVTVEDDGTVVIPPLTGLNGEPKRWREVAPYVWQEIGGQERVAAQVENGRVRMVGADSLTGIMVFLPVGAAAASSWIIPAVMVAIVALLLTVVAWPVAAVVRRRRGAAFALSGREALGYRFVRVAAVVNLVFLLGWVLVFSAGEADLAAFDGRMDPWLWLLRLIGLLVVAGAAVATWNAWLTFHASRGLKSKTWAVVLAASCVALAWFAFAFHLISFDPRY